MEPNHTVPSSALAPIMREWCAANEPLAVEQNQRPLSAKSNLAQRSGVKSSIIGKIMSGSLNRVEFDVADKILCAMDSPLEWYDRLADYYYGPEETVPMSHRIATAFIQGETLTDAQEVYLRGKYPEEFAAADTHRRSVQQEEEQDDLTSLMEDV